MRKTEAIASFDAGMPLGDRSPRRWPRCDNIARGQAIFQFTADTTIGASGSRPNLCLSTGGVGQCGCRAAIDTGTASNAATLREQRAALRHDLAPVSARYLMPNAFSLDLLADIDAAQTIYALAHVDPHLRHGIIQLARLCRFACRFHPMPAHHPVERLIGICGESCRRNMGGVPFEFGLAIFVEFGVAGRNPHAVFRFRLTGCEQAFLSLDFDQAHPA